MESSFDWLQVGRLQVGRLQVGRLQVGRLQVGRFNLQLATCQLATCAALCACLATAAQADFNGREIQRRPDMCNVDMVDTVSWYAEESVRLSVEPWRCGKRVEIPQGATAAWVVCDEGGTNWIVRYDAAPSSNRCAFALSAGEGRLPEGHDYTGYVSLLSGTNILGVLDRHEVRVMGQAADGGGEISPEGGAWGSLLARMAEAERDIAGIAGDLAHQAEELAGLERETIPKWPKWYKFAYSGTNENIGGWSTGLYKDDTQYWAGPLTLAVGTNEFNTDLFVETRAVPRHGIAPKLNLSSRHGDVNISAAGSVNISAQHLVLAPTNGAPTNSASGVFTITWNGVGKTGWGDITAAAEAGVSTNAAAIAAHAADTGNPHGVTAEQSGALPKSWTNAAAVKALSVAGGASAVRATVGTRADGAEAGERSATVGSGCEASAGNAFAQGVDSAATGYAAFAAGVRSSATQLAAFAAGVDATAAGTNTVALGSLPGAYHDWAFVWSGGTARYSSHADGSFNVNPAGGETNFWVGPTSLGALLDRRATTQAVEAVERRIAQLQNDTCTLFWSTNTVLAPEQSTYYIPTNFPTSRLKIYVWGNGVNSLELVLGAWNPGREVQIEIETGRDSSRSSSNPLSIAVSNNGTTTTVHNNSATVGIRSNLRFDPDSGRWIAFAYQSLNTAFAQSNFAWDFSGETTTGESIPASAPGTVAEWLALHPEWAAEPTRGAPAEPEETEEPEAEAAEEPEQEEQR